MRATNSNTLRYSRLFAGLAVLLIAAFTPTDAADVGKDLVSAAEKGDAQKVQALLSAGGDFQTFDRRGESPLDLARAKTKRPEIAALITEHIRQRVVAGIKLLGVDITRSPQAIEREIQSGRDISVAPVRTSPPDGFIFVIVDIAVPGNNFSPYAGGRSENTKDLTQTIALRDNAQQVIEPLLPSQLGNQSWVTLGKSFGFRGQTLKVQNMRLLYTVREGSVTASELRLFDHTVGQISARP
jgi:hypothetical protein